MADPATAQPTQEAIAPGLYFNGFGVAAGSTDMTVILLNGNFQVGAIQASPSVFKELVKSLTETLAAVENATGMNYPSLGELMEKIQENRR